MPDFVLDSHAVLEFLFGEPNAPKVRGVLEEAKQATRVLMMSVVNWAEVLYRIRQEEGPRGVAKAHAFAQEMAIVLDGADVALAEAAAEFKAAHRISLADAFAAALARREDADLVTGDPELTALKGIIRLRWIS